MNERLSIQDLINLFAEKHGMNKKDADWFVKEFFLLIEQGLENDKYVKIKGLGTFRLIDVDSRESVNVNTGERFQIQGHTKVSFTPDTVLRDIVNKPFGHFETVVLNENTILEDTPMDSSEDDTEEAVDMGAVSQPSEKSAVEEIAITTGIDAEKVEEAVVTHPEPQLESNMLKEQESAVDLTDDSKIPTEDSPITAEEPVTDVERVIPIKEPQAITEEESPIAERKQSVEPKLSVEDIIAKEIKKTGIPQTTKMVKGQKLSSKVVPKKAKDKKSPVSFLIATIFVILLLCGGAVFYIYNPDILSSLGEQEVAKEEKSQLVMKKDTLIANTINNDTINKDTVAEVIPNVKQEAPVQSVRTTVSESTKVQPKIESVKNEPIKVESIKKVHKPAVKTGVPVKPDSVNYEIKGTKATYTVKEGETLTRVSLQFYGTKDLWPYIVKYNSGVIKNPDNVPYGTVLRIPELVKK